MRAWTPALAILIIVAAAGTVSAHPRHRRHHARHHRHHRRVEGRHAREKAHRAAEAKPVAKEQAAPAPKSDAQAENDVLVLSDYAPGRHAWVGP